MKTSENAAIVVLIVSALMLTGLLVMLYGTGQKAYADASARSGKYTMVTGAFDNDNDLLYVVDIDKQQMNVYHTDARARKVVLRDRVDLKRLFAGR